MRKTLAGTCVALLVAAALIVGRAQPADVRSRVDHVFAKWTAATPGCAVGVASGGRPVLAAGYGTADLEHDVAITPDTIFEAGSVSKQFTAASDDDPAETALLGRVQCAAARDGHFQARRRRAGDWPQRLGGSCVGSAVLASVVSG
jgi:beta-lactamase family protein